MPIKEDPLSGGEPARRARTQRRLASAALALAALALAAGGGYVLFWRYHAKRYQAVRPGVFYRTGQPTVWGLRHLIGVQRVRTVVSLQLFDPRLESGLVDVGEPDGPCESEFVRRQGAQHVQWPMGDEGCWPWLTPWQFDEFFKLFDEPENWPVAVHCAGGRHRTGTLAALFRLEYDRWPVERTLAEMYSFDFGLPIIRQEHHLRTYLPRPRPSPVIWTELRGALGPLVAQPPIDYEDLVRQLRRSLAQPPVAAALEDWLRADRPFALALAHRLVAQPNDALAAPAAEAASRCLERTEAEAADWSMAAALVADFGTKPQQARLLQLLADESRAAQVSPRYAALAAGVTNRYTPNRLPYLRPLLHDTRHRVEPAASDYRYCDTAALRLSVIADEEMLLGPSSELKSWDDARTRALAWLEAHPDLAALSPLRPPWGRNVVRAQHGREGEDLTRMRR